MSVKRRLSKLQVFLPAAAAILLSLTTACAAPKQVRYQAEFLQLFDTVTQIVGYSDSEEHFREQAGMIHDYLEEYHRLYDIYNDYEGIFNLKTVNDQAGIAPVRVDQRIIDLLEFGKEMYEETDGNVNIAFGSVLSIWHESRREGIEDPEHACLPDMELLKEAARHTDISKVIIDPDTSTVYLEDPGMRLDVGAVAKGYSVEQTARFAMGQGIDRMLISVGGNVRAIGSKDSKTPWKIAVQNPNQDSDQAYLFNMLLANTSLVSSGDYQRYYTVDGKRYHHIIDPASLMPASRYSAVSVICPDSGKADALSTALFNMSPEEGLELVGSLPDTEAMWISSDGSRRYSSSFEALISH